MPPPAATKSPSTSSAMRRTRVSRNSAALKILRKSASAKRRLQRPLRRYPQTCRPTRWRETRRTRECRYINSGHFDLRGKMMHNMEKVDEQALLFMQKSVQANRIKVNTTEVGRRQEDRRKDRDGNRRSTPPRQSGARRRRRASWRRRRRPRKARRPRRSTPSSLQESAFTKGKSCSEQVPDGEIEQTIKESMPGSAAGKTGAVRHPAGLGEGGAGRSDSKHRR